MNTGVAGIRHFCRTSYNTYSIIIYLFVLLPIYRDMYIYVLYDKSDLSTKTDEALKINVLSCHESEYAEMTA